MENSPSVLLIVIHALSSLVGLVGACMNGIPLLRGMIKHGTIDKDKKVVRRGKMLLHTGLGVAIITGAILFIEQFAKLMQSGRFTSILTVFVVLIVIESMYRSASKHITSFAVNRTLSLFTWVWIFILASLEDLNAPYLCFIAAYVIIAFIAIMWVKRAIHKRHHPQA